MGSCSPEPEEILITIELPDIQEKFEVCEALCNNAEVCLVWSLLCEDAGPCICSSLGYSYLHSCSVIGGNIDTELEVRWPALEGGLLLDLQDCLSQNSGDCGALVEENCQMLGEQVLSQVE